MSKEFILVAFFLLLLCSCVMTSSQTTRSFSVKEIDYCYSLFSKIMIIQTERSQLTNDMSSATSDFKNSAMTKDNYHMIRTRWLRRESVLASDVNSIYNEAYSNNCFDSPTIPHEGTNEGK